MPHSSQAIGMNVPPTSCPKYPPLLALPVGELIQQIIEQESAIWAPSSIHQRIRRCRNSNVDVRVLLPVTGEIRIRVGERQRLIT